MYNQNKIAETVGYIAEEVQRAKQLHPGEFHNMHEALGVLREEYIELENEVFFGFKKVGKDRDIYNKNVKEEAIQLAAMCVRLITELT